MPAYNVRLVGDPILRKHADEILDFDNKQIEQLTHNLYDSMKRANGLGICAPQIGVSKRLFVWNDNKDRQRAIANPVIVDSDGEWEFTEGCLSLPNVFFPIVRPRAICMKGLDLGGNEIEVEESDLIGRIIQHEIDHLNGVLLIEHLTADQKESLRDWRNPELRAIRKGLKTELGTA